MRRFYRLGALFVASLAVVESAIYFGFVRPTLSEPFAGFSNFLLLYLVGPALSLALLGALLAYRKLRADEGTGKASSAALAALAGVWLFSAGFFVLTAFFPGL